MCPFQYIGIFLVVMFLYWLYPSKKEPYDVFWKPYAQQIDRTVTAAFADFQTTSGRYNELMTKLEQHRGAVARSLTEAAEAYSIHRRFNPEDPSMSGMGNMVFVTNPKGATIYYLTEFQYRVLHESDPAKHKDLSMWAQVPDPSPTATNLRPGNYRIAVEWPDGKIEELGSYTIPVGAFVTYRLSLE
jgi:hypothetical protein